MPGDKADGRPEVQIRSTARIDWGNLPHEIYAPDDLLIMHEVACVWCPWSSHTSDVREAVRTADDHEMSLGHTHSREEALAEGRPRRELWELCD